MPIPKIIHQVWNDDQIPARWHDAVASVKRYHPDWRYELWTAERMDAYVKAHHPRLYPVFASLNRQIMRADVIRYVLMSDFGGLYCDLDYEFIRPYPYGNTELLLALEYAVAFGDRADVVASYVFASAPGHVFWRDLIDELIKNPPAVSVSDREITSATGPGFVSRVFFANEARYRPYLLAERPLFSPARVRGRYERSILRNNNVAYGFHIGAGSWKQKTAWAQRFTGEYWKRKMRRLSRAD